MSTKTFGVVQAFYDGTDLGWTFEDTTAFFEELVNEAKVAQQGENVFDRVSNGVNTRVEMSLTAVDDLEKLAIILGGTVNVANKIVLSNSVGISQRDNAKELVLKAVVDGCTVSTDPDDWFTLYKAFPMAAFEIASGNTQKAFALVFNGYVDCETSGQIGDVAEMGQNF